MSQENLPQETDQEISPRRWEGGHLIGIQVPEWLSEEIKSEQQRWLKIDQHLFNSGAITQEQFDYCKEELAKEPYIRIYIQEDPRSRRFVLGVERNLESTLFIDIPHGFETKEAAVKAAESLAGYIESFQDEVRMMPEYNPNMGTWSENWSDKK